MPNDVIITPSTGRVQFVKDTGQALLRYNIDLSPATGLIIDSPLTSSVGIKSPNLADLSGNNTFAGATTFNGATTINGNLSVYGATNIFSASNIYITSSVLTVTDNILTLNALSPYQRYAGIEMYDTGSGTLSSILWDGTNDYFFLTGSGVNGKLITGPDGQTDLTSNYIPKATAGYKLGNSVIYETGSNIGIGTTSPGATLHVSGSSGATATFQGSTQSTMNLKVGSFDNYLVGTSTGDISIRPSGSTAVTILSGGNVGIGTTNPSGILDIQSSNSGDQLVRNWNTNTSGTGKSILRIANSGNNAQGTQLQFTDLNYYVGTISSDRTNGMAFYVGQQATPLVSERMRIDINGNVGIGTTSPVSKLHIEQIQNAESLITLRNNRQDFGDVPIFGISAQNNTTDVAKISFYRGGGGNSGYLTFSTKFDNASSLTEKVRIDGAGNVGIGTTNPSAKFHVTSSTNADEVLIGTIGNDQIVGGRTGGSFGISTKSTSNGNLILTSGDAFYIRTSGSNDRVIVKNDGNFGIGTTNPTSKLHIVTTGTNDGIILDGSTNPLFVHRTSGTDRTYLATITNAGAFFTDAGQYDFIIRSQTNNILLGRGSGASTMAIVGNNVGIGTTLPSASLHIKSSTSGATLLRTDGTNGTLFSVVDDLSDSLMSVNNSAGLPVLEVFADDRIVAGQYGQNDLVVINNKIGIGTNNPTAKLYVTSSTSMPSAVFLGGNVGIGTTSPVYKLDVYEPSNVEAGRVYNNNQAINFNIGSSTNTQYTDLTLLTSNGNAQFFKNRSNTGWGGTDSLNIYTSNGAIAIHPAGYQNAIYFATNGNVGIGTSNPSVLLHISGSSNDGVAQFKIDGVNAPATFNWASTFINAALSSSRNYISLIGQGLSTRNSGYIGFNHSGIAGSATNFLTFGLYGVDNILNINGSGYVGIGTTAPTTPLHVVGVISGSSFTGAGTGLTGTAASLTAGTANALNASNNYQVNSIGVNIAGSGTAGRIGTNENGVRSWTITPTGGKLVFDSGDGLGSANFTYPVTASVFFGAGTGLTGTAAGLSIGGNAATATSASFATIAATATTANNVNNGQLSFASGSGITISAGTFTANQSGNTAFTISLSSNSVTVGSTAIALGGTATTIAGLTSVTSTGFTGSLVGTSSWASNVVTNANLTGDVTSVGNATTIANNAVTTAKILDANVTNAKLANSSLTIGSTAISLGGTATTIAGLSSLTSTNLTSSNIYVSGNVGIGTSNPTSRLHISSSTAVDVLLESGTTGTSGKIIFKTSDNTDLNKYIMQDSYFMVFNAHSNEGFKFRDSSNTTLMTVYGTTNSSYANRIGMGTTTPIGKLEVNGGSLATTSGSSIIVGSFSSGVSNSSYLNITETRFATGSDWQTARTRIQKTIDVTNQAYIDFNPSGSLYGLALGTGAGGTERMRIDSNGNVGIGSVVPGYKLDVSGSFRTATGYLTIFNDYIYVSPTNTNTLNSGYGTNGIADMWINFRGYQDLQTQFRNFNVGDGKGANIAWFDGTNKRMSLNNGQAASYTLHVNGTAYINSTLQVNSNITLSGGGDVIINDSDGTGFFALYMDNNVGYMRVDDAGSGDGKININNGLVYIQGAGNNVGIGTTIPGQKLDVEGRIRTRGATGTGGFEIGAATTGTAKWRIEWDSASDSLDFNWVG